MCSCFTEVSPKPAAYVNKQHRFWPRMRGYVGSPEPRICFERHPCMHTTLNNVDSTLIQRQDVESTVNRRCLKLCAYWNMLISTVLTLSIWTKLFCVCICYIHETSRKTYLYNFDPLKSHFYIVKLGFTGVYIIFLISAQKHRLWLLVSTASSRRF